MERPLQEQGLCRESASDFGTFHPQKFPSWWFVWGFGFCLIFVLETSIFTMHVNWSAEKGAQDGSRWTDALFGFYFLLGLRGKWFLEVRVGPHGGEKYLFGDRGTRMFHHLPASALSYSLARRACPPQIAGPDLCLHLSKHRGKKPQRKGRKFIYIYIYIYIYI